MTSQMNPESPHVNDDATTINRHLSVLRSFHLEQILFFIAARAVITTLTSKNTTKRQFFYCFNRKKYI